MAEKNSATRTWQIDTIDELKAFRNDVNGGTSYKGWTITLGADIDLNNETWTPIGNLTNNFQGTFDGGECTISNLKVDTTSAYAGFFGYLDAAVVKDLTFENVDISGGNYTGTVAGYTTAANGTCQISGVTVTGTVTVTGGAAVGGIIGGGDAALNNVTVNATGEGSLITGKSGDVGGIAGLVKNDGKEYAEGSQFSGIASNINVKGEGDGINAVGGIFGSVGDDVVVNGITSEGGVVTSANVSPENQNAIGGITGVYGSDVVFKDVDISGKNDNYFVGIFNGPGSAVATIDSEKTIEVNEGDANFSNIALTAHKLEVAEGIELTIGENASVDFEETVINGTFNAVDANGVDLGAITLNGTLNLDADSTVNGTTLELGENAVINLDVSDFQGGLKKVLDLTADGSLSGKVNVTGLGENASVFFEEDGDVILSDGDSTVICLTTDAEGKANGDVLEAGGKKFYVGFNAFADADDAVSAIAFYGNVNTFYIKGEYTVDSFFTAPVRDFAFLAQEEGAAASLTIGGATYASNLISGNFTVGAGVTLDIAPDRTTQNFAAFGGADAENSSVWTIDGTFIYGGGDFANVEINVSETGKFLSYGSDNTSFNSNVTLNVTGTGTAEEKMADVQFRGGNWTGFNGCVVNFTGTNVEIEGVNSNNNGGATITNSVVSMYIDADADEKVYGVLAFDKEMVIIDSDIYAGDLNILNDNIRIAGGSLNLVAGSGFAGDFEYVSTGALKIAEGAVLDIAGVEINAADAVVNNGRIDIVGDTDGVKAEIKGGIIAIQNGAVFTSAADVDAKLIYVGYDYASGADSADSALVVAAGTTVKGADAIYVRTGSTMEINGTASAGEFYLKGDTTVAADGIMYVAGTQGIRVKEDAQLTVNGDVIWDLNLSEINNAGLKIEQGSVTVDGGKLSESEASAAGTAEIIISEGGSLSVLNGGRVNLDSVTNAGTIYLDETARITAETLESTGSIIVDAEGSDGINKIIDLNGTTSLEGLVTFKNLADGVNVYYGADGDVYLIDQDQKTIYVDSVNAEGVVAYNTAAEGKALEGYNKFDTLLDASEAGVLVDGVTVDYGNAQRIYTASAMTTNGRTYFKDAGVYTITGGKGAYLPYVALNGPDVVVNIEAAHLTMVQVSFNGSDTVSSKGAQINITNTQLDAANGDGAGLAWLTAYGDTAMTITNSVVGLSDSFNGSIGDIAVGNAAASDVTDYLSSNNWYGRAYVHITGSLEMYDSTLFAAYGFNAVSGGTISLDDSVVYTSRIELGAGSTITVTNGSSLRQAMWGGATYRTKIAGTLEVNEGGSFVYDLPGGTDDPWGGGNSLKPVNVLEGGQINVTDGSMDISALDNAGTITLAGSTTVTIDSFTGNAIVAADGTTLTDSAILGGTGYTSVETNGYKFVLSANGEEAGTLNLEGENTLQNLEAGADDTVNVTGALHFVSGSDGFKLGNGATWNINNAVIDGAWALSLDGAYMTDDDNAPVSNMTFTDSTLTADQISAKGVKEGQEIGYGTFNVEFKNSTVALTGKVQTQAQDTADVNISFSEGTSVTAKDLLNDSTRGTITFDGTDEVNFSRVFRNKGTVKILNGAEVNAVNTYDTTEHYSANEGTINVNGAALNLTGASTFANSGTIALENASFSAGAVNTAEGTFTVAGEGNTLNIGTLAGTLQAKAGAALTDSTVGGTGTVQALGNLTFAGDNSINALKAVNGGTITVEEGKTLALGNFSFGSEDTAGAEYVIDGGTITANYGFFQHGVYTLNADFETGYMYYSFGSDITVNGNFHSQGAGDGLDYIRGKLTVSDGGSSTHDKALWVGQPASWGEMAASLTVEGIVSVGGTLAVYDGSTMTVNGSGTVSAGAFELTGTLTINAGEGFDGIRKVVDVTGATPSEYDTERITLNGDVKLAIAEDGDIFIHNADMSTFYVDAAYTGEFGKEVAEDQYLGINAFNSFAAALDSKADETVKFVVNSDDTDSALSGKTITGSIETENADGVTIADSLNSNYVNMTGVTVGENVTLDANLFYLDGSNTINGDVKSSTTFYSSGKLTLTGNAEVYTAMSRYYAKADDGIYVVGTAEAGKGAEAEVQFKAINYLGHYSGTFSVKDTAAEFGYILLGHDAEVSHIGDNSELAAKLVLDNARVSTIGGPNTQPGQVVMVHGASIAAANGSLLDFIGPKEFGYLSMAEGTSITLTDSEMRLGKEGQGYNTINGTITMASSTLSSLGTINVGATGSITTGDSGKEGGINEITATKIDNQGTINVGGMTTMNIGTLTGNAVNLLEGATLFDSVLGGESEVVIKGNATVKNSEIYAISGMEGADGNVTLNIVDTVAPQIIGTGWTPENVLNGDLTVNVSRTECTIMTAGSRTYNGAVEFNITDNSNVAQLAIGLSANFTDVAVKVDNSSVGVISAGNAILIADEYKVDLNNAQIGSFEFLNGVIADEITIAGTTAIEGALFGADLISVAEDSIISAASIDIGEGARMTVSSGAQVSTATVTNNGSLTIDAASTLTAVGIAGAGTITIDAANFKGGLKKIIDLSGTNSIESMVKDVTNLGENSIIYGTDGDVYLTDATRETIYVGADYADQAVGTVVNDHIVGFNAFADMSDAMNAVTESVTDINVTSDTVITGVNGVFEGWGNDAGVVSLYDIAGKTVNWKADEAVTIDVQSRHVVLHGEGTLNIGENVTIDYSPATGAGLGESLFAIGSFWTGDDATAKPTVNLDGDIVVGDVALSADNGSVKVRHGVLNVSATGSIDADYSIRVRDGELNVTGSGKDAAAAQLKSQRLELHGDASGAASAYIKDSYISISYGSGRIADRFDNNADGLGYAKNFTFENSRVESGSLLLTDAVTTFAGIGTDFTFANVTTAGIITLDNSNFTASKVVTNTGSITIDADSYFTAAGITGEGTITIDAADFTTGIAKIIDLSGTESLEGKVSFVNKADGINGIYGADGDVYLTDATCETIYVSSGYTGSFGDVTDDGKVIGFNAFNRVDKAVKAVGAETSLITVAKDEEAFLSTSVVTDHKLHVNMGQNGVYVNMDGALVDAEGKSVTDKAYNWIQVQSDVTIGENVTVTGDLIFATGGSLTIDGVVNVNGMIGQLSSITINGTLNAGDNLLMLSGANPDVTVTGTLKAGSLVNYDNTYGGDLTVAAGGSVTVTDDLVYTGSRSVAVEGELTANGDVTVDTLDIAGEGVLNVAYGNEVTIGTLTGNGTVMIDLTDYKGGTDKLIDFTGDIDRFEGDIDVTAPEGATIVEGADGDIYITNQKRDTLYVNPVTYNGEFGTVVDGLFVGFNAFATVDKAVGVAKADSSISRIEVNVTDEQAKNTFLTSSVDTDQELTIDMGGSGASFNAAGNLTLPGGNWASKIQAKGITFGEKVIIQADTLEVQGGVCQFQGAMTVNGAKVTGGSIDLTGTLTVNDRMVIAASDVELHVGEGAEFSAGKVNTTAGVDGVSVAIDGKAVVGSFEELAGAVTIGTTGSLEVTGGGSISSIENANSLTVKGGKLTNGAFTNDNGAKVFIGEEGALTSEKFINMGSIEVNGGAFAADELQMVYGTYSFEGLTAGTEERTIRISIQAVGSDADPETIDYTLAAGATTVSGILDKYAAGDYEITIADPANFYSVRQTVTVSAGTIDVTGSAELNIGKLMGGYVALKDNGVLSGSITGGVGVYGTTGAIKDATVSILSVGYGVENYAEEKVAVSVTGKNTITTLHVDNGSTFNAGIADGERTELGSDWGSIAENSALNLVNTDMEVSNFTFNGKLTLDNSVIEGKTLKVSSGLNLTLDSDSVIKFETLNVEEGASLYVTLADYSGLAIFKVLDYTAGSGFDSSVYENVTVVNEGYTKMVIENDLYAVSGSFVDAGLTMSTSWTGAAQYETVAPGMVYGVNAYSSFGELPQEDVKKLSIVESEGDVGAYTFTYPCVELFVVDSDITANLTMTGAEVNIAEGSTLGGSITAVDGIHIYGAGTVGSTVGNVSGNGRFDGEFITAANISGFQSIYTDELKAATITLTDGSDTLNIKENLTVVGAIDFGTGIIDEMVLAENATVSARVIDTDGAMSVTIDLGGAYKGEAAITVTQNGIFASEELVLNLDLVNATLGDTNILVSGITEFNGTLVYSNVEYAKGGTLKFAGKDYTITVENNALVLNAVGVSTSVKNDVDGNGYSDIIMLHEAGFSGAWLTQSDGSKVVWADLADQAANIELLGMGKAAGTAAIFFHNTENNYVGAWTLEGGEVSGYVDIDTFNPSAEVIGLGDFNGDGATDVLLRVNDDATDNNEVGAHITGTGWTDYAGLGDNWEITAVGDFNGDGKDDIVLVDKQGNHSGMWLMRTEPNQYGKLFDWSPLDTLSDNLKIVGAGDVNGDGCDDVLISKAGDSGAWLGAWIIEDGVLTGFQSITDKYAGTIEGVGDFNGDGIDDIQIRVDQDAIGYLVISAEGNAKWQQLGQDGLGTEWITKFSAIC